MTLLYFVENKKWLFLEANLPRQNLQQATVSGSSSDSSENPRKAVPWVAAAAENWNHMAVHGPKSFQLQMLANACPMASWNRHGKCPNIHKLRSFSPSFSPNFPNIHQSHPSKEQKQTRKPLPWTAPSLRDHVPQVGVPSWEKRQWTTSFPAFPKCNEKKLEKGPKTRKTKNLFARLSLQFACQGFWPLRRWEKCWVKGRNIDCSIMRDRFEQTL